MVVSRNRRVLVISKNANTPLPDSQKSLITALWNPVIFFKDTFACWDWAQPILYKIFGGGKVSTYVVDEAKILPFDYSETRVCPWKSVQKSLYTTIKPFSSVPWKRHIFLPLQRTCRQRKSQEEAKLLFRELHRCKYFSVLASFSNTSGS